MSMKILSVIVPSYNMERYLDRSLGSLFLKDPTLLRALDIVVVNDGSSDSTGAIAREYEKKYPSIVRVIDKANGNYGSCINAALPVAKGVFVKILDADDSFDTIGFETFLKELVDSESNNENVDLFISEGNVVDEKGQVQRPLSVPFKHPFVPINISRSDDLSNLKRLTHHMVTYRTSVVTNLKYEQLEKVMYSDQEWVCLPFLCVKKYKYLKITLYNYLVGRDGQSMRSFYHNLYHQILIKKHLISFYRNYKQEPVSNLTFEIIGNYIASLYRHYLIESKNKDILNELSEFDSYLFACDTEFYNSVNEAVVSPHFKYKFIKHWRKKHNSIFFRATIALWRCSAGMVKRFTRG